MPVIGAMPMGRRILAQASSCWNRTSAVLLIVVLLWLETEAGEETGGVIPFNKLALPDLGDRQRLVPFFGCRHGVGEEEGISLSSRFCRSGQCIFSSVAGAERWRLLQLCCSGRWPASVTSPVTFLVEWRPYGAEASLLAPVFPPGLCPYGRQLSGFNLESSFSNSGQLCCRRWKEGAPTIPSGMFPGDGRSGSGLKTAGPDCFSLFQMEVLLAHFRDCVVIIVSFESSCELCTFTAEI